MNKWTDSETKYFLLEFILRNVASVVFIMTGILNFYKIRDLSFQRAYKYSFLFKIKLAAIYLLILINVVEIVLKVL